MSNLFSLNPNSATPENKNIYTNILNSLNDLDSSNNVLINTLKKLRDESYENEKRFFEVFISKEQQKTTFSNFFSNIDNISTYINFLAKQNATFFSKLLIGREFQEKEENFIDFLYSKELIAGLKSDEQLRFNMNEVQGKKTIGSGHAITIKDFLEYVWNQLREQAIEMWSKEYSENVEIPEEKMGELCRAMMEDLANVNFVKAIASSSHKANFTARGEELVSMSSLLGEYSFTVEEDVQQQTLLVQNDIIMQDNNKQQLLEVANQMKFGEKTLQDLESKIHEILGIYLKQEGIEVEDKEIESQFYTPIYIDKKEFKKIKFGNAMGYLKSSFLENKTNQAGQFAGTFAAFLEEQLSKAGSSFTDAKDYWKNIISKNDTLIKRINTWGQSYTNGAGVIGHVGEHFASFYLGLNETEIYGQALNKLGQQAHVDVAYANKALNGSVFSGFQIKNYSSVVNSFHLYDTDVSVFRKDIRRYIAHDSVSGNDDIIVQLRYLSANEYLFKNLAAVKSAVKKVLEMNFEYWSRYGDFQSNLGELKNNFFILNFKMIPASLIFQKIICELKEKKSNNKYFNLNDFPLAPPDKKKGRQEVDLSNDASSANLASESGGRIVYNGFTFNLKEISKIKYTN